ncbi:aquaporin family protein [Actinomadura harenae]|uniref:Aquaporin family protein n=1 Tax=Actinomadura harenae TaxID=2483351 RepID=A0A3M2LW42_9ACTN|nr:aquaporin family protein [Actinomadura harenae]
MRRCVAEALGTGLLLAAIVGSGILGARLSAGNTGVALLANALATGAVLFALIEWLAPISGAHFNPLVSLAMAFRGDIKLGVAAAYVPAQLLGGFAGVGLADAMFGAPVFAQATHESSGSTRTLAEFVATFGLLGIIWTCSRTRSAALPAIVAAYVVGIFWFTPTGYANPAVALARTLTDTPTGIRPQDIPALLLGEAAGTATAIALLTWLTPNPHTGSLVRRAPDRPNLKARA